MLFDFETIKKFYEDLSERTGKLKAALNRPLTLSEKILYNHLDEYPDIAIRRRGIDYVSFRPDRVAMQDATAQMAILQFMLAGKESSSVPASVHCDHLIMARMGADEDLKSSGITNREVYDFLSSACNRYKIGFWKPGAGIIHQIILENYAFPGGMIIGTDSHTPNAGGLGMIAVGVGGADAADVMTGLGLELKFPRLTGIRLKGKLKGWTSAKDVILKVAGLLTVRGGTGSIVEYFGDGAASLSCTGKATICNMGAEIGATCSIFGYDEAMDKFLRATGREKVAALASENRQHLVADQEVLNDPEKFFDQYLEIDLDELEPYINGPFTPDIATPVSEMKDAVKKNGWPEKVEVGLIGSCTNSSYEDLSRAASVVRNSIEAKLSCKAEFRVTPGSEQIRALAEKEGYLDLFGKIGGVVFANACGPCIGQWDRKGSELKQSNTVIHSFNRNFARRTDGNPNTHAFVASPEIVTAIAIAGKLTFNPLTDKLLNAEGREVMIPEPAGSDLPAGGFINVENGYQGPSGDSSAVEIKIDPESERLQLLKPFPEWDGKDFLSLHLLIKAKGKCTTDHISMAGFWLKYRGHLENISNNYMIGAVNFFNDQTNSILNPMTGAYENVPAVARALKNAGTGSLVAGEENFGEGSSREHAAMEPRYLGVKAIIVKSFARIHETNLKKQGILALTFADKDDYNKIREDDRIDIRDLNDFAPGRRLPVTLHHSDGSVEILQADHSYNEKQISWFKAGGALNLIRKTNKQ